MTVPSRVKSESALSRPYSAGLLILIILIVGACLGSVVLLATDPRTWFLIISLLVGVVFLALLLHHTRLIVFLVVLYAPFELLVYKLLPEPLGNVSRYVTEAILLVTLLALVGDRLFTGKPWKRTPLDVPLLLFVGAGILSAAVNSVPSIVAVLGMRSLLRYVLVYYLVTQIGFNDKTTRRLVFGIVGTALVVVGLGFAQAIIGQPLSDILTVPETTLGETVLRNISTVREARGTYIYSTLGRYDLLGLYTALILLLLLALYIHYPRRRALLVLPIMAVSVCLMLTMSRQSWMVLYSGLVAWVFVRRNVKLASILIMAPLFLTALAMLLPHLVRYYSSLEIHEASILNRLLELYSPMYLDISAYSGGRLDMILHIGPRILEKAWLFGFGPGRFGSLTANLFGFSAAEFLAMPEDRLRLLNDVNWITVLGQFGLLGTATYALMLATIFRFGWRVYRRSTDPLTMSIALASLGSVAGLVLAGFLGPNFEQRVISMYVWLIAGMMVSLARIERLAPTRRLVGKANEDSVCQDSSIVLP